MHFDGCFLNPVLCSFMLCTSTYIPIESVYCFAVSCVYSIEPSMNIVISFITQSIIMRFNIQQNFLFCPNIDCRKIKSLQNDPMH